MFYDGLSVMRTSLATPGPFSGSQWRPTGSCLSRMQGYMYTSNQPVLLPRTQMHVTTAPALLVF